MALRIRKDGRVLCAAIHPEEPGDTYIDDTLHYEMSVEHKVLVTEEYEQHQYRGEWWWAGNVPAGIVIAEYYLKKEALVKITIVIKKMIQKIKCSMPFSFFYFLHGNIYVVKKLSRQSELIKCRDCGKMFAINHDVRVVLPWETVRSFYEEFDIPDLKGGVHEYSKTV